MNKIAQIRLAPEGGFSTPAFSTSQIFDPGNTLANIISITIGAFTAIAGIYFLFQLITGAISIIGSGGDKAALESARGKITYGVVGLVVIIGAVALLGLLGTVLGIDFLDLNATLLTLIGN